VIPRARSYDPARRPALTIAILAAGLVGCAEPALLAGAPRVVDRMVVAPYASHELCAHLSAGDRLDYRYQSSAAVDYEIHFREDNAVLAPVVREQSTSDSGTFVAPAPREYCLAWQAGAPGAIIGYRVLLRPKSR
jgi:hypothetical protein